MFNVSVPAHMPTSQPTTERLLMNQTEIDTNDISSYQYRYRKTPVRPFLLPFHPESFPRPPIYAPFSHGGVGNNVETIDICCGDYVEDNSNV